MHRSNTISNKTAKDQNENDTRSYSYKALADDTSFTKPITELLNTMNFGVLRLNAALNETQPKIFSSSCPTTKKRRLSDPQTGQMGVLSTSPLNYQAGQ